MRFCQSVKKNVYKIFGSQLTGTQYVSFGR